MTDNEKIEVGSVRYDKTVVHKQEEPIDVSLTREVTPEDIKKYGQHYLELVNRNDEIINSFKYVDAIQVGDSPDLVKVKEGSGWAGVWLGKDMEFTILDLKWDENKSPLRVVQFHSREGLRGLPKSRSARPEGDPFVSAANQL